MKNTSVHTILFALIFVFISGDILAQAFTDAGISLPGISKGVCLWGDYDGDHDPDILLSGKKDDGTAITAIFNNTNGVFTQYSQVFPGLDRCQAAWVDLENDGDLDFSITGFTSENKMYIFRNDDGVFTELSHCISYFGEYSDLGWCDFDNDGDSDLIISGTWMTKIYFNEGSYAFTGYSQDFAQLNSSRISITDIDKDGDNDILLSGDSGAGMVSYIYLNEAGIFSQSSAIITGLSAGSSDWGDYDSDGDADLIITGFDDLVSAQSFIYSNNGDVSFSKMNTGLTPVSLGNVSWADYDTDGDLDFLLTGKVDGCGTFVSQVYKNEGNNVFSAIYSGLSNADYSYGSWGDYDLDGDLDIVLCGSGTAGSFTKVYRNDSGLPDFLPSPPENLQASLSTNEALLSWDKSTDTETLQDGLTYNLRIGTNPGGNNVMSSCAAPDGYRFLAQTGNASQNNSWILKNLPQGTYYWSVQALDNTFAGSGFSNEVSFTIIATNFSENQALNKTVKITSSKGIINIYNPYSYAVEVRVFNLVGKQLKKLSVREGITTDIIVTEGFYLVETYVGNGKGATKIFVR